MQVLRPRTARVFDHEVRRALPHPERRSIGPFCFLDHFGPHELPDNARGIGPHPHTGLQTVSWLFAGRMFHGDSLGSEQEIQPGQLNLMTAGRGITHWEYVRPALDRRQHGVQLWVALPDTERHREPAFEHHAALPTVDVGGWRATVFLGSFAGARSRATAYSPIVGAELTGDRSVALPLDPTFEHGILVDQGEVGGLLPGQLGYLAPGSTEVELDVAAPARCLLIGGAPFTEPLRMWWNFVGRTHDDIARARSDWEAGVGFGDPSSWPEPGMPAPPLAR